MYSCTWDPQFGMNVWTLHCFYGFLWILSQLLNNAFTAAIHIFDQTIEPFDEKAKEEDYINLKDLQKKGNTCTSFVNAYKIIPACLLKDHAN